MSNSFYFLIACKVLSCSSYSLKWNETKWCKFSCLSTYKLQHVKASVEWNSHQEPTNRMCLFIFIFAANYIPQCSVEDLFEGTWYLVRVDEKHRRTYARRPIMGDGPLEAGVEVVHPGIVHEVNTVRSFKVWCKWWNGLCGCLSMCMYGKRWRDFTNYFKCFVKICNIQARSLKK